MTAPTYPGPVDESVARRWAEAGDPDAVAWCTAVDAWRRWFDSDAGPHGPCCRKPGHSVCRNRYGTTWVPVPPTVCSAPQPLPDPQPAFGGM